LTTTSPNNRNGPPKKPTDRHERSRLDALKDRCLQQMEGLSHLEACCNTGGSAEPGLRPMGQAERGLAAVNGGKQGDLELFCDH
ncbi:hypothetical protein, partial [Streptomyces zhihengii]|uniref:hypothetical protein n=1 Tax=Streptomyces zhihengii TaxID=1818004 RepID=UPI00360F697B